MNKQIFFVFGVIRGFPSHSTCICVFLQVWRGALARMRCRKIRAIYTIMAHYKCYKVKAHFWEVDRRFTNVRNMADYGKSVEWPTPPAALVQFHRITQHLYRRYFHDLYLHDVFMSFSLLFGLPLMLSLPLS